MNRLTALILVSFALVLGVLVGQGRFPPPAAAYPAGAAVSYGANPVVATGGSVTAGSSATLFTAPAGQDIVVTDLVLTGGFSGSTSSCSYAVIFASATTGSGAVAAVNLVSVNATALIPYGDPIHLSFASGLPIASGETLSLSTAIITSSTATGCDPYLTIAYTATGYYAEP